MNLQPKVVVVSAAIIRNSEGYILLTKRSAKQRFGGKWEFPGGKAKWGEDPREALTREIMEELNVPIQIEKLYDLVSYTMDGCHWVILFFLTRIHNNCARLSDRIEYRWVAPSELSEFDIIHPNQPIVNRLKSEGIITTPSKQYET